MKMTTWDGLPVSPTPPFGATVVVSCCRLSGRRYLLLHRAHKGPEFEGDWAWTPPSGARLPDEAIEACAVRELKEETGIDGRPVPVRVHNADWAIFLVQLDEEPAVTLDKEHDRFVWVSADEALSKCLPSVVAEGLQLALSQQ
jgi:8-oxo-dGTP pyrophosphatase MutT (NUDIX family)